MMWLTEYSAKAARTDQLLDRRDHCALLITGVLGRAWRMQEPVRIVENLLVPSSRKAHGIGTEHRTPERVLLRKPTPPHSGGGAGNAPTAVTSGCAPSSPCCSPSPRRALQEIDRIATRSHWPHITWDPEASALGRYRRQQRRPGARLLYLSTNYEGTRSVNISPLWRETMRVRNTTIERLLKPSEVCQILRVSRRTLTQLTATGVLPFVRIGGSVRFVPSSITEILRAQEITVGQSCE